MRPPIFLFGACPKRKIAPRPVEERKGRFHAGFPPISFEPIPAEVRAFLKTGCNRGTGCRLCFRAETLRLALHGAGGEIFEPSSRRSPGNPTGVRRPPWPFQLGRVKGGEENGIFPSLAAFLLSLFFGPNKEK